MGGRDVLHLECDTDGCAADAVGPDWSDDLGFAVVHAHCWHFDPVQGVALCPLHTVVEWDSQTSAAAAAGSGADGLPAWIDA